MPHTQRQERYFRYKGIPFLPGKTESDIKKLLAKKYGVTSGKIQIDRKSGTQSTYIVTIFKHKKPQLKIGSKTFIIS